jgi:hypothetical protein
VSSASEDGQPVLGVGPPGWRGLAESRHVAIGGDPGHTISRPGLTRGWRGVYGVTPSGTRERQQQNAHQHDRQARHGVQVNWSLDESVVNIETVVNAGVDP